MSTVEGADSAATSLSAIDALASVDALTGAAQ